VEGGTNRSYGIQVARLAGIPPAVIGRAKKILYNIEQGEYDPVGSACLFRKEADVNRGPVQLDLFRKPENPVFDKLSSADISRMTPLEALNFLNELQEKLKT
jgi:DNA mismatch repair protein MutS